MTQIDRASRLRTLRQWQRLLDSAFRVPGTSFRFGWDPIVGLVPWAGDVLAALMSCALVMQAHQMRVPRVVQLRMLLNVGIDMVVGIVPFVGDVADVFWKSNTRNLALLERHAGQTGPATSGDWLFVIGVMAAILLVAALPILVMYWILHEFFGRSLV
ncbi:MAG: DUF4112 domain-containing protein [Luteitalea sp.]|nr:DUF4112 domain-containing protein [Luteitalea sp.]